MITEQERKLILDEMKKLLDEYNYDYEVFALNEIIDEWDDQKSKLIDAFKKHPNYIEGKFLIAFDTNYDRNINIKAVNEFSEYLDRH